MAEYSEPRIGLVTDCDINRHILQTVLADGGYGLAVSLDSSNLADYLVSCADLKAINTELDAWLVDVQGNDIQQALDLLVETSDLPLLVNDELPSEQDIEAHETWRRRLLAKLEVVAIRIDKSAAAEKNDLSEPAAERVWVLAASLGGPEAVKNFLAALPPDLPLAMVYGQHIESNFDGLLATAMGSQLGYSMRLVGSEHRLVTGEIAVVPVDHQLRFLAGGRVVGIRKPWPGVYQPVLDQVIAELARVYRQNLGVIIFSGTCNDGEIGCRVVKACGGTVWAQSPESCLSPDMPNAAISTGCVSYQGTPERLAESLATFITDSR